MMNDKELKVYQTIMYKLTPIVSDYITGYKTDFTVYDIPVIIDTILNCFGLYVQPERIY